MLTKQINFIILISLSLIVVFSSCRKDPEQYTKEINSANSENFDKSSEYQNLSLQSQITEVQPMTGIVLFSNNPNANTTNKNDISLEFSYVNFNDIISEEGDYDWEVVESLLDEIQSRNHQAILRFRYTFPGKETTVPNYIKERSDYHEIIGQAFGQTTHFPDWTCPELKNFTKEFHEEFANEYEEDPRIAFIQVGFGFWAEYHLFSGPFQLGVTFPDKNFQEEFFYHLASTYNEIQWMVGLSAIDDTYSPIGQKLAIKNDNDFGIFDDSFMQANHSSWNEVLWNKFGMSRYEKSPNGGEFNYYTTYDQQHVLDLPNGAHGKSWEQEAAKFHMSFIFGNNQPSYQTSARIKQASMASGYHFKITKFRQYSDYVLVEVKNTGVAPIYYDAYITLDGDRADESLKYLLPNQTKTFIFDYDDEDPELEIECDYILDTQKIQFEANL